MNKIANVQNNNTLNNNNLNNIADAQNNNFLNNNDFKNIANLQNNNTLNYNNFQNKYVNIGIEKNLETGQPNQQIKLERTYTKNINTTPVDINLRPFNQFMENIQPPLINKDDAKSLYKKLKHTKNYNDFNYSFKNHLNFIFFPCWHKKNVDQKVMTDYLQDKLDISNYFDLLDRFDTIRNFILEKEINFLLGILNKKTLKDVKDSNKKEEMKEDINKLIDTYTYFKNKIDTEKLDANESRLLDMTHDAFRENLLK